MISWLAGLATGISAARLSSWINHIHQRRMGPPKGSYGPPQPAPGMQRVYYNMPTTIAECGGPCTFGGPELCDCGQLWCDVPIKPQFPPPRKIREDFLP